MAGNNSEKIGVLTATIVGMNAMIGAGIFTISSALAGDVGPAVILSFLFTAVSVWFMAQSFARVAQLFPQEGSFYTYARQWGGTQLDYLLMDFI
ncbi:MAG: amino acid permease [Candidatus Babeliales bacterium]|jgi:amino acid transporter